MAQNFLDRLDESVGMEEYDINKGIANAAMQRGISPVEMRAQVLKQNLQAIGRTISDDDLRLFALGEITLSDVMGRTLSDQDLGGRTIVRFVRKKSSPEILLIPSRVKWVKSFNNGAEPFPTPTQIKYKHWQQTLAGLYLTGAKL